MELVNKYDRWHFSAQNTCAEQVEVFNIEEMALRLESQAPLLWSLIGHLLFNDPSHNKRKTKYTMGENITEHNEHVPWDEEDKYWAQLDEQEDTCGSSAADDDNERCHKYRC